jgi:hypothetical protein
VTAAVVAERPHGYARYKLDGCRCNVCGFAVSEYTRLRTKAIRTGTWRVDAEKVRAHVRSLMAAGMGRRRIAAVADVNGSTLSRHLYGRNGRPAPVTMRHDLAQKLLNVRPDLAPSALVPSVGTVRRLRALAAIGWTLPEVAAAAGWTLPNLCDLVSSTNGQVTVRTARMVAALYERLSMTPPAGPGAARARARAGRRGWVPPLAWNEGAIDDPKARPHGMPLVDEVAA